MQECFTRCGVYGPLCYSLFTFVHDIVPKSVLHYKPAVKINRKLFER